MTTHEVCAVRSYTLQFKIETTIKYADALVLLLGCLMLIEDL